MTGPAPVQTEIPAGAYRTLASFRDALRHYDHASLDHVRAAGLTAQQYALLVHMAGHEDGSPSVGELAQALLLGHNSVVELSQRAERHGLLRREVDPERGNRTLLFLTEDGARRVDHVTRALVRELGPERLAVQTSLSRWEVALRSPEVQSMYLHPGAPLAAPAHTVRAAEKRHRELVWRLLQQHLHLLSPYHQVPMTARGEYRYAPFGQYWSGSGHRAWVIRVDRQPAGFALLQRQRGGQGYLLSELGIVPAWQGRGLARAAVRALLAGRAGPWSVSFHHENVAARRFWQRVLAELALEVTREVAMALPMGDGWRWDFTVTT